MRTSRQSISRKPQASSSNRQTKQELNNKAWEEFVAYQHLKNANSAKYGHVIRHLKERNIANEFKLLGNDREHQLNETIKKI